MRDTHQEITNRIIEALENTNGKWDLPWHKVSSGMPVNIASGKKYRGINVPLLMMEGRSAAEWGTYKQWKDKGYQVQKGEKGTAIVLFKPVKSEKVNAEGEKVESKYLLAKTYTVFNIEQTDCEPVVDENVQSEAERIHHADEYIKNTDAVINYGGNKAFYAPSHDVIQIPNVDQFKSTHGFYSTVLHELTHWTGHKSRCDRDFHGRFGDEFYAAEELVAELGAAFLCGNLGLSVEPREDHVKYIKSWLKVLKNDKKAIFTAASKAQAAIDHLDSLQMTDEAAEAA